MKLYAIINGDIIGSTRMSIKEREEFMKHLQRGFEALKKIKTLGIVRNFEIYRGDSFQGALEKPEGALRAALLLRSLSRMSQPTMVKVNPVAKKVFISSAFDVTDLRIAVGIGTVTVLKNKLMESDGEAFRLSGRLFDSMKRQGPNLAIETSFKDMNKELEASWGLIDAIVNKWTRAQAEVVYYCLLGYSQVEIAKSLIKVSPPALNQRLKGAGWSALEKMITYFEETIQEKQERS
jgi:hypothetical protein